MEIRILSLWQPWASLVAMNLKQFETRPRGTKYRGKIAIHACKTQPNCVNAELERIYDASGGSQQFKDAIEAITLPLPQGCILAIADLTQCSEMTNFPGLNPPWREISLNKVCSRLSNLELAVGDWRPGRYAWKLENIRPIANPIYYRGKQGLTIIREPMVVQQIEEQLALTDRIEQQLQAIKEAV